MTEQRDPPPGEERPGETVKGLLRVTATVGWHASAWWMQTSVKAGRRLAGVLVAPETAVDLAEDVRGALREYARELVGMADLEQRLGGRGEPAAATGAPARHPGAPAGGATHANGQGGDEEWAELRRRGEEILRRSRDVHYEETAHPAYERILDELAPDEVRILRLLLLDGPQPAVDIRTGGPVGLLSSRLIGAGFSMLGPRAGVRYPDRVPGYLNNLFRLGMVWFSRETLRDPVRYQVLEAQPDVLAAIKSVRMAKVVRRSIHLTPFGEDFCRVCLALRPGELADLPQHGVPPEASREPPSVA